MDFDVHNLNCEDNDSSQRAQGTGTESETAAGYSLTVIINRFEISEFR